MEPVHPSSHTTPAGDQHCRPVTQKEAASKNRQVDEGMVFKHCSVVSVTSITLVEVGILPNAAMLLLLSRVLFCVVSMAYYYHLGRKPKKI